MHVIHVMLLAMDLLGYTFKNPRFLDQALSHRSLVNESRGTMTQDIGDNERFEFLGDAVLELAVSEMLLEAHPKAPEGHLSKVRASLVNEKTLAMLARSLRVGEAVRLGRGEEQSGGRQKDSILASTLEAVVAAIYMDSGFEGARHWLRDLFRPAVEESRHRELLIDYKTRLQELVQARFRTAPKYATVKSSGPDHDKTFEVEITLQGKVIAKGRGKSKKEAEQAAARQVYESMSKESPRKGNP